MFYFDIFYQFLNGLLQFQLILLFFIFLKTVLTHGKLTLLNRLWIGSTLWDQRTKIFLSTETQLGYQINWSAKDNTWHRKHKSGIVLQHTVKLQNNVQDQTEKKNRTILFAWVLLSKCQWYSTVKGPSAQLYYDALVPLTCDVPYPSKCL